MGWWDDLWGKEKTETTQDSKYNYEQLADYPEAKDARESMWDRLQSWGDQPGYGAVPQAWDDIWSQSKKKVNEYYWGSATDPGMVGKLGAEAAKRGQTDQPAYLANLSKLGKEEAGQLTDIATQQSVQKALFAEKGRTTWMDEMNYMMGLKPQYQTGSISQTGTSQTGGGEGWGLLSDIGEAAVGMFMPSMGFGDMFGVEDPGKAVVGGNPNSNKSASDFGFENSWG